MNQQVLTSRGLAITLIKFDRDRDLIKTELDTGHVHFSSKTYYKSIMAAVLVQFKSIPSRMNRYMLFWAKLTLKSTVTSNLQNSIGAFSKCVFLCHIVHRIPMRLIRCWDCTFPACTRCNPLRLRTLDSDCTSPLRTGCTTSIVLRRHTFQRHRPGTYASLLGRPRCTH